MRAIDADALIEAHYEACNEDPGKVFEAWSLKLMEDAPTIEEQKKGKWIQKSTYYEADECECSLCGQTLTTHIGERMNFCPNCGEPMEI